MFSPYLTVRVFAGNNYFGFVFLPQPHIKLELPSLSSLPIGFLASRPTVIKFAFLRALDYTNRVNEVKREIGELWGAMCGWPGIGVY